MFVYSVPVSGKEKLATPWGFLGTPICRLSLYHHYSSHLMLTLICAVLIKLQYNHYYCFSCDLLPLTPLHYFYLKADLVNRSLPEFEESCQFLFFPEIGHITVVFKTNFIVVIGHALVVWGDEFHCISLLFFISVAKCWLCSYIVMCQ